MVDIWISEQDRGVSVPKDLANCWTEKYFLYYVASHRSWERFITVFGEGTPLTEKNFVIHFFFKPK